MARHTSVHPSSARTQPPRERSHEAREAQEFEGARAPRQRSLGLHSSPEAPAAPQQPRPRRRAVAVSGSAAHGQFAGARPWTERSSLSSCNSRVRRQRRWRQWRTLERGQRLQCTDPLSPPGWSVGRSVSRPVGGACGRAVQPSVRPSFDRWVGVGWSAMSHQPSAIAARRGRSLDVCLMFGLLPLAHHR